MRDSFVKSVEQNPDHSACCIQDDVVDICVPDFKCELDSFNTEARDHRDEDYFEFTANIKQPEKDDREWDK